MVLGSWAIAQMQGAAKTAGADTADIGYMPFPDQVDGKFHVDVGGDYKIAINMNSKNKAAARAWVDWFIDESGYAADQGGIPTSVDRRRPRLVQGDFQDAGVEYLSQMNPAPEGEEGLRDKIDNAAEIDLWGNVTARRIVDDARGATNESKDQIFADLNKKWADAKADARRLIQLARRSAGPPTPR